MFALKHVSLPTILLATVLVVPTTGTLASDTGSGVRQAVPDITSRLKISITTKAGIVWGKVTASYIPVGVPCPSPGCRPIKRTCAKANCSWKVFRGATLHLTQKPKNAATWPFEKWVIIPTAHRLSKRTTTKSSISFKMKAGYHVRALYVPHTGYRAAR